MSINLHHDVIMLRHHLVVDVFFLFVCIISETHVRLAVSLKARQLYLSSVKLVEVGGGFYSKAFFI